MAPEMTADALTRATLFEGLGTQELAEVASLMGRRRYEAGEPICRQGEPGDEMFVVLEGIAHVLAPENGDRTVVAKLRRGDVVGEMSLLTGEPRTATVVAGISTTVLELGRDAFAGVVARNPNVLANLTRILSHRLARTTRLETRRRRRGEAVALLAGPSLERVVSKAIESAQAARPGPIAFVDANASLEQALGAIDDLLEEHATVVVGSSLSRERAALLLEHVDRTVALVADPEVGELVAACGEDALRGQRIELVRVQSQDAAEPTLGAPVQVFRTLSAPFQDGSAVLGHGELAWLGRHLSGTKLGLALGAGGAKGYAHVGALQVLEEAGYTVDCVAGSSIGAIVGAWLALGMSSAEIEQTMRSQFTPDAVAEIFQLSLGGASSGLEAMTRILQETTAGRTFDDLLVPLVAMTVSLTGRRPEPVSEGLLSEALLAATALAGIFPPYERDGERLVDGLALVPVPTSAVAEAGADIVVSVNLISRETLPSWPGGEVSEPEPSRGRVRMLDTLLEVMDLAQLDSSVRHAALADVVVTPRFGPSTWRDFHLADLFLAAGREAAEEQVPVLRALASPQFAGRLAGI